MISACSAWECSWLLGELAPCVCSPGGTADERVSEHPSWLDLNWFFFRSTLLVTGTLSVLRSEHWYFFLSLLCFSAVYLLWVCCMSSLSKCRVFLFLQFRDLICPPKPGGAKMIFWGKLLKGIWLPSSPHSSSVLLFTTYPSSLSHSNNSEISLKIEEPHACLYHDISFQANAPYYEMSSLCFAFIYFLILHKIVRWPW